MPGRVRPHSAPATIFVPRARFTDLLRGKWARVRVLMMKIEKASGLDRIGDRLQQAVQTILRPKRVRDLLHGVWLGHPLHPAMVQVPVGAWISAGIVDLMPGQRRVATTLVAVGTASALPAAVAGLNDWAALARDQRRVGLVHAASNTVGLALYAGSLAARLRGRHDLGRTLAYLGLGAATAGAYVGGHLAYKQGAQVNQSISEAHLISEGWHQVADVADLPNRTLVTREVDGVAVIVYRHGDEVTVMLERCPHQSGPLGQGEVVDIDGHACVVCPWHGSTFQLNSGGKVVHGPAPNDQQVLATRVVGGVLETRLV